MPSKKTTHLLQESLEDKRLEMKSDPCKSHRDVLLGMSGGGITYEEASNMLCSMFESWDRDTLLEIFQGNNYHLEQTIESILAMEGVTDIETDQSTSNIISQSQMETDVEYARSLSGHDETLPIPGPRPSRRQRSQSQHDSRSNYRGIRCSLPDNFLRPPGWINVMEDEQLAIMLQNEMFRREVLSAMSPAQGEQFERNFQTNSTSTNRSHMHSGSAGSAQDPNQDLGILKGLAEMGEGMKKQLSALATRFNSASTGSRSRSASTSGGPSDLFTSSNPLRATGAGEERAPLMQRDAVYEEEEEDNSEIINFDSSPNRGGHSLNDDYVGTTSTTTTRRVPVGGANKKDK
eukprot:gene10593-22107_t